MEFIAKYNLISNAQYWFRPNVSTSDAIIDIIDHIISDNTNYNAIVSIDLKKAFDSLSHKMLLIKLSHYGFRGTVYNLLEYYLSERVLQYVNINTSNSHKLQVRAGI